MLGGDDWTCGKLQTIPSCLDRTFSFFKKRFAISWFVFLFVLNTNNNSFPIQFFPLAGIIWMWGTLKQQTWSHLNLHTLHGEVWMYSLSSAIFSITKACQLLGAFWWILCIFLFLSFYRLCFSVPDFKVKNVISMLGFLFITQHFSFIFKKSVWQAHFLQREFKKWT